MKAMEDSGLPSKRRNDGRPRRNRAESGDEDLADGFGLRDAYKSEEQIREELEMRQASREEVKAVFRAVMQVSAGTSLEGSLLHA